MDQIASALGDAARWRIVELLAERPRSVGEIAEVTGLRQPQATKHLQTLARVGLATVVPLAQRRVYVLEEGPLAALLERLTALLATSSAHAGEREIVSRYRTAIESDTAAAVGEQWADGRSFFFERTMASTRLVVWRHLVTPELLATWWAPPSMTVVETVLEPREGGQAVLEYRDAEGAYRSEGRVRIAHESERIAFDLSVLDAAGAVSFTGHYDLTLAERSGGTVLRVELRISETTVDAVPYIAGIETGWGQVLDNLVEVVDGASRTSAQRQNAQEKTNEG